MIPITLLLKPPLFKFEYKSDISNNFTESFCLLSLYRRFFNKEFFKLVLRNFLLESRGLCLTTTDSFIFSSTKGLFMTS